MGEAMESINQTTTPDNVIISRMLNATRERVWQAWTVPDMVKKWWGPKDFTVPFSSIDFKEGGKYLNCMQAPDGKKFWSTGSFKEIVPLEKFVCSDSFADEKGNVVPASYYGMGDEFPQELEIRLTFEARGDQTLMVLNHSGVQQMNAKDRADMEEGWNQSFDKLADVLADYGPTLNY